MGASCSCISDLKLEKREDWRSEMFSSMAGMTLSTPSLRAKLTGQGLNASEVASGSGLAHGLSILV